MTVREPALEILIADKAGLANVSPGKSLETIVWNHLMSRTGGLVAWSNPLLTQAGTVLASDARGLGWDPSELHERIEKDCAVSLRDPENTDVITFDLTVTNGTFQLASGRQKHTTMSHVFVNPDVFVYLDATESRDSVPDAREHAETSRFDLALSGAVQIGPGRQVLFGRSDTPSNHLAIEYVDEDGRCVGAFSGLPFGGIDFVAGWEQSGGVVRPSIQPLNDLSAPAHTRLPSIRPAIPRSGLEL